MFKELVSAKFLLQEKISNDIDGKFGNILTAVEQVNGKFELTMEYLNFVQMFISSAMRNVGVAQIYNEIMINVSFILSEIFSKFAKWWYTDVETKSIIGKSFPENFDYFFSYF